MHPGEAARSDAVKKTYRVELLRLVSLDLRVPAASVKAKQIKLHIQNNIKQSLGQVLERGDGDAPGAEAADRRQEGGSAHAEYLFVGQLVPC